MLETVVYFFFQNIELVVDSLFNYRDFDIVLCKNLFIWTGWLPRRQSGWEPAERGPGHVPVFGLRPALPARRLPPGIPQVCQGFQFQP